MAEPLGYFTFVLHSHLPYVIGHGRWPHGMDWLNEAAAESYIPLLQAFNRLGAGGRGSGVTLGITPILAEMLAAKVFPPGVQGLPAPTRSRRPADDLATFKKLGDDHFASVALMWKTVYGEVKRAFCDDFGEDIIGAFRRLMDKASSKSSPPPPPTAICPCWAGTPRSRPR